MTILKDTELNILVKLMKRVPVMERRAAFEDVAGDYGLGDRDEADMEFVRIAAILAAADMLGHREPMHDPRHFSVSAMSCATEARKLLDTCDYNPFF